MGITQLQIAVCRDGTSRGNWVSILGPRKERIHRCTDARVHGRECVVRRSTEYCVEADDCVRHIPSLVTRVVMRPSSLLLSACHRVIVSTWRLGMYAHQSQDTPRQLQCKVASRSSLRVRPSISRPVWLDPLDRKQSKGWGCVLSVESEANGRNMPEQMETRGYQKRRVVSVTSRRVRQNACRYLFVSLLRTSSASKIVLLNSICNRLVSCRIFCGCCTRLVEWLSIFDYQSVVRPCRADDGH